jgi:hypothetical protein
VFLPEMRLSPLTTWAEEWASEGARPSPIEARLMEECGDLVLASFEMAESRLDTGPVVPVAILSSAGLVGEREASRLSLLVQLAEAGLGRDEDFSRGRGRVGTLIYHQDWSCWNSGRNGEIALVIRALNVSVGSKK